MPFLKNGTKDTVYENMDFMAQATAMYLRRLHGAPQVILALSTNAAQVKAAVDKAVNQFAARGFRSLGVAQAKENGQWQFLGVLPLFDPPREDAQATIETASQMGVKIKMLTGDTRGHGCNTGYSD